MKKKKSENKRIQTRGEEISSLSSASMVDTSILREQSNEFLRLSSQSQNPSFTLFPTKETVQQEMKRVVQNLKEGNQNESLSLFERLAEPEELKEVPKTKETKEENDARELKEIKEAKKIERDKLRKADKELTSIWRKTVAFKTRSIPTMLIPKTWTLLHLSDVNFADPKDPKIPNTDLNFFIAQHVGETGMYLWYIAGSIEKKFIFDGKSFDPERLWVNYFQVLRPIKVWKADPTFTVADLDFLHSGQKPTDYTRALDEDVKGDSDFPIWFLTQVDPSINGMFGNGHDVVNPAFSEIALTSKAVEHNLKVVQSRKYADVMDELFALTE